MPRRLLVPVMGCTLAGKSTLLEEAGKHPSGSFGRVEVGKTLRAKYPPGYFQGQAAPQHTQQEAWDLCEEGVRKADAEGFSIILIDGQPRDLPQVELMCARFPEHQIYFIHLHASLPERERRARLHRNTSPENLDLALQRLKNDMITYYDVLVDLQLRNQPITYINTEHPEFSNQKVLEMLLLMGDPSKIEDPELDTGDRRPAPIVS